MYRLRWQQMKNNLYSWLKELISAGYIGNGYIWNHSITVSVHNYS